MLVGSGVSAGQLCSSIRKLILPDRVWDGRNGLDVYLLVRARVVVTQVRGKESRLTLASSAGYYFFERTSSASLSVTLKDASLGTPGAHVGKLRPSSCLHVMYSLSPYSQSRTAD